MMGFNLATDKAPITKGSNCLFAPSVEEAPDPGPAQPCIRCGRCAEACPAGLLPQQLYWYSRAKDLEKAQDYHLFDCIECGCCSHVCPSHIPLVQYYRFAKNGSWAKEQERREAEHAKQRHDYRVARLERLEAERKARLRKKKEDLNKPPPKDKPSNASTNSKKAAIEAAMKRAAEKKAKQQVQAKNMDNLTPDQQAQINAADERRAQPEGAEKSTQEQS
jgi:electron transport complex protein RnfC